MYSGVLTYDQADAVFNVLSKSNNSDYATRPMTMGANGYNNKQVTYMYVALHPQAPVGTEALHEVDGRSSSATCYLQPAFF